MPAALAAWQASECGQQRPLVVRGRNLTGETLKTAEAGGRGWGPGLGAAEARTLFPLLYVLKFSY